MSSELEISSVLEYYCLVGMGGMGLLGHRAILLYLRGL